MTRRPAALSPLLLLLPLAAPMVACTGEEASGEAGRMRLCLGRDGAASQEFGEILHTITGTVVSDGPGEEPPGLPTPCSTAPSRVLVVDDRAGDRWSLGYGVSDADADGQPGADLTPALDVAPGDSVTLRFRGLHDFGDAYGFVLTDRDGVIAAFEDGSWGPGLADDDVPGLAVTRGAQIVAVDTDCGRVASYKTIFTGDSAVTLAAVNEGAFTLGGAPMTALAVADWDYLTTECTDTAGARLWAVWR